MTHAKRKDFIWLDGQFVPWEKAQVHVLTHTLHYGMGVFEGIRVYETEQGSAIFRLNDHIKRLFRSALIMNMKIPYTEEELKKIQETIIKKNKLSSAYIRPMVFYGSEHLGLQAKNLVTHVMVAAWEWGPYFGKTSLAKGIKLQTSSFRRHSSNSSFAKAKANGNYVNSIMALQEAHNCGSDDALMLDNHGFVAEASGANIFIVRDNYLLTPEPSNILEGITRDTIIRLASEAGISVKERQITREEIYIADEAFLTGTAAELTPVVELDHKPISDGKPGKITELLQTLFAKLVQGKLESHRDWLTFI